MNKEQREFWENLLAYYRQELEERQQPTMVSMLSHFHGQQQAQEDKRLAERGFVYLLKDGKLRTKHIDELSSSDAPFLMAEIEANEAMAGEHSTVEGHVTVTKIPGGPTLTHPHYEDATRDLRKRWRELKRTWPA